MIDKCKRCNGTGKMEVGEYIYARTETCNLCDGSGKFVLPVEYYVCRWSEKLDDMPPQKECSRYKDEFCDIDGYKCRCICYRACF
jgi:RecJ-like exonuclease